MNVLCIVVFFCENQYCAKENSTMLELIGFVSQITRDNFD